MVSVEAAAAKAKAEEPRRDDEEATSGTGVEREGCEEAEVPEVVRRGRGAEVAKAVSRARRDSAIEACLPQPMPSRDEPVDLPIV